MWTKRRYLGVFFSAILAVSMVAASVLALLDRGVLANGPAGDPGPQPTDLQPGKPPLPPKPKYAKLDSHLNQLVEARASLAPQQLGPNGPLALGQSVAVTVRLSSNVPGIEAFLRQGSATMANVGTDYIEAHVPIALLAELQAKDGVLRVDTIIPPRPATTTSQGTTVHRSNIWNTAGYTGAGVKVGIIDVGFEGFVALMGTELPATVTARCYTDLGVFTSNVADCQARDVHGTAVAETIMDAAPGATLYISNPQSTTDLNAAAAWMVSQGVKVINHSVGWLWQGPGDGTSPFSNSAIVAVNTAASGGAVWVNSAGNEADSTWYGSFNNPDGDQFLNFTDTDETSTFTLGAGEGIMVQLRWDDSWTNASKDLDLLLYNSAMALVASSTNTQAGAAGQTPEEWLEYTAPAAGTYHVVVGALTGAAPSWVQLQMFDGPDLQYYTPAHSIGNPAESANTGMLAVGAAYWNTTSTIEPFSSQGPTTDGRVKPDIVGADGGASVTYGPSGFYGTSQASPHVAGLAALVRQRYPEYTPAQVVSYLKANALPRGSPVPNNTWGAGLAQLPSLAPGAPTNVTATSASGQATVSWTAPSFDGGSSITQYTVTSSPGGVQATIAAPAPSATVTGLTNGTSYTFTVVATNAVGNSAPSSASNAVTPMAATKLAFTTQPSASNSAGVAFGTQPIVTVQDANGNTVSNSSAAITLAITSGTGTSGATLSGTVAVNAINGVATFSGLSIDKAGSAYTLAATSSGLASATSATFNVASTASKLVFITSPSASNTTGVIFGVQPVVTIEDVVGNTVTNSSAQVTLAIATGTGTSGATLGGTVAVNAVNGVATFSGLSLDKAGTGYRLTASSPGLAPMSSVAFDVIPPPATRVIIQGPTMARPGEGITVTAQVLQLPSLSPVATAGLPVLFNYVFYKLQSGGAQTGSSTVNTDAAGVAKLDLTAPMETTVVLIDAVFLDSAAFRASSDMWTISVLPIVNAQLTATTSGASVTFTLKDVLGNALSGRTLTFAATSGNLSAYSAVTDANGQVTLTVSGTADTVVSASFGGWTSPQGWAYQPTLVRVTVRP